MVRSSGKKQTVIERDRKSMPEEVVTRLETFNRDSVATGVKPQSLSRESSASNRAQEKSVPSSETGACSGVKRTRENRGGRKETTRQAQAEVARKTTSDSAMDTLPSTFWNDEMTNQRKCANESLLIWDKENDSGAGSSYATEQLARAASSVGKANGAKNNSKHLPSFGERSLPVRNTPQPDLEYIRRMRCEWLTTRRTDATWIQCCHRECGKWRLSFEHEDAALVPEEWFCNMNMDPLFASCDEPEEEIPREVLEEQVETKYHVGSIVWARLDGYPWSPAIVDDCPEELRWCQLVGRSIIPTKYHVVFFNSKEWQRAWIRAKDLKPYQTNSRDTVVKKTKFRGKDYTDYLDDACALANDASFMTISGRLEIFGWAAQWTKKGPAVSRTCLVEKSGDRTAKTTYTASTRAAPRYNKGDLVWAHLKGCPWWPAIVDECPRLRKYHRAPEYPGNPAKRFARHSQISDDMHLLRPEYEAEAFQSDSFPQIMYHTVYLNEKALEVDWLPQTELKPFSRASYAQLVHRTKYGKIDYRVDLENALALAQWAERLSATERLRRFGVCARHTLTLGPAWSGLQRSSAPDDASSGSSEKKNLWSDLDDSLETLSPSDEPGSSLDADATNSEADICFDWTNWNRGNDIGNGEFSDVDCQFTDFDGMSIFSKLSSSSSEPPVKIAKKSTTLNDQKCARLIERGLFFKNPSAASVNLP